jgi:ABC-type transporter Mla MlaB component
MLRISECNATNEETTLRLEGRIIGRLVIEVENACEAVFARGCKLILDLSDLSFIDRNGLTLFRDLLNRQVTLVNCSPFLLEQLKIANSPYSQAAVNRIENLV